MRLIKKNPLLSLINSYIIDSPQPSNISYMWNFGSLLALSLVIQIISGIFLAANYCPDVTLAFNSIEHIMRDVNYGWLIRYIHANVASLFFVMVYLHIGRGMYYGSYKHPRTLVWIIGVVIFLVMVITAFLGYCLVFGQMSLWGATVITNLMSAIPYIGNDLVQLIWGGFSVNNATLNRFFSFHFLMPFIIAALAVCHMIALHENGSSNPLGVSGNVDRIPMSPYFLIKDLITIFLYLWILGIFVFYAPNYLGHSDNYIPADPLVTPASIVPEWYLLPFYAILRSIPDKLGGVLAMISSILILLILPLVDNSKTRNKAFVPISKFFFWTFVSDFLILMYVGSQHVEPPFIVLGQLATIYYFAYFLLIVPFVTILENKLLER